MNTKTDALHSPVGSAPRQAAFTLIELLTVIAIIGILAAILFPVISKARQSAKLAGCASNLRQIGVALTGYLNDNKGALPGRNKLTDNTGTFYGLQRAASATWYYSGGLPTRDLDSQLLAYLNSTNFNANGSGTTQPFLCPANPNGTKVANYYIGTQVLNTNGALQRPIGYNGSGPSMMYSQISNPSRAAFLFDLNAPVLALIGAGASNTDIANRLVLSSHTVKSHINRIFAKTGSSDRPAAIRYARRTGLV